VALFIWSWRSTGTLDASMDDTMAKLTAIMIKKFDSMYYISWSFEIEILRKQK